MCASLEWAKSIDQLIPTKKVKKRVCPHGFAVFILDAIICRDMYWLLARAKISKKIEEKEKGFHK